MGIKTIAVYPYFADLCNISPSFLLNFLTQISFAEQHYTRWVSITPSLTIEVTDKVLLHRKTLWILLTMLCEDNSIATYQYTLRFKRAISSIRGIAGLGRQNIARV